MNKRNISNGGVGINVGDRVRFIGSGYMESMHMAMATVCAVRADGCIGLLFDDRVAYEHDCSGFGVSGGYCAWVNDYEVELCDGRDMFELPAVSELF